MPCMAQCQLKATEHRPSYDTEFLPAWPGVADAGNALTIVAPAPRSTRAGVREWSRADQGDT